MFTGIVENVGVVEDVSRHDRGRTFTMRAEGFAGSLAAGDSVSINGACHTVERADAATFVVTSVGETLARTTMGRLAPDDRVNLEAAATAQTALGGHIVQGHVDGVGRVVSITETGEDVLLELEVPADVHGLMVSKGSIAVDGVSLTVIAPKEASRLTITIIPHTLLHTTIGAYETGTEVNIEADVLGKYVMAYMRRLGVETVMGHTDDFDHQEQSHD